MLNLQKYLIEYQDFTDSAKKYNNWFINIRYFAIVALIVFYIYLRSILHINFTPIQFKVFSFSAVFILTYNLFLRHLFNRFINKNRYQYQFYISLTQMVLDLTILSVLNYFLGGIESPLFYFYIFHMIIGSILFPQFFIYSISVIIIIVLCIFSLGEYIGNISHHFLLNYNDTDYYKNLSYIITKFTSFTFLLITTIYLTSKIVLELFNREKHLKRTLLELDEAEKNKQKFIIGVVHELKSPLAASVSQADLILSNLSGDISDQAKDRVAKIKDRLSDLIKNINEIIHISRFKLLSNYEFSKVDIKSIINKIIEQNQVILQQKKLKLEFNAHSELQKIDGDPILLNLAFSNIIGNAIKYNNINGEILVSANIYYDGVMIEISDDGIGIPVSEKEHIFDNYYRASNAVNMKIEGTGTGLSLVKQIIESHKGTITFESPSIIDKQGKPGTTFKIYLPDTKSSN